MGNIVINQPYVVLTDDQYQELYGLLNGNNLGDFFQIPGYSYWFALRSDLMDGDLAAITGWIDEVALGEAYFTNSVQPNITMP